MKDQVTNTMTGSPNASGQNGKPSTPHSPDQHDHSVPRSPSSKLIEPQNQLEAPGSNGSGKVEQDAEAELSGRERLKKHRVEMSGRVWIPEVWGQEDLLNDWADCTAFDAIRNSSLMSARAALIEEGRMRANSSGLSLERSC